MHHVRMLLSVLLIACCAAMLPAKSDAETMIFIASAPLASTNWNQTMSIPKFPLDSSCLESVCFRLEGHVQGAARFESIDAAPATVSMNLQSTITLQRPDGSILVTTIPLAQTVDNVAAFDGAIDFAGTSGKTYSDLSGDKTESACTSALADRVLFTGSGDIVLPVAALGTSYGSGAGNLILQFNTSASAQAVVTYTYHCAVGVETSSWGQVKSIYR